MKYLLLLFPVLAACRSEAPTEPPKLTAVQQERRQLLLQPKPGWKPDAAPRKLNILLLLEKTRVRQGEAWGYRVETQNAGSNPFAFKESAPSFIKDGSLCGSSGFKLYAAGPKDKEALLPCLPEPAPGSELDLTVLPGEYLLTRGSGPEARFRPLRADYRFEAPGMYRLRAVYALKDGFRAVSNTVTLEVVP